MKYPKCSCGGELIQVGVTMTLVCRWCDLEYDVEDLEALEQDAEPSNTGVNTDKGNALGSGEN